MPSFTEVMLSEKKRAEDEAKGVKPKPTRKKKAADKVADKIPEA